MLPSPARSACLEATYRLFLRFWPWLESQRESDRLIGQRFLVAVMAAGCLFGVVQTLRGAHRLRHTLWVALICWGVTWAWHRSSVFFMEKVQ